jgi:putative transposase
LALPGDWTDYVNGAETEAELAALRRSVFRGAPFGGAGWQAETAAALGLESAMRRRGRPHKTHAPSNEI